MPMEHEMYRKYINYINRLYPERLTLHVSEAAKMLDVGEQAIRRLYGRCIIRGKIYIPDFAKAICEEMDKRRDMK